MVSTQRTRYESCTRYENALSTDTLRALVVTWRIFLSTPAVTFWNRQTVRWHEHVSAGIDPTRFDQALIDNGTRYERAEAVIHILQSAMTNYPASSGSNGSYVSREPVFGSNLEA